MTTLSFPLNPTIGQQYINAVGTSWIYDGVKWTVGQVVTPTVVVTPEVPPVTPAPAPATTVYDPLLNISLPVNPTLGQIYTAPDGIAYIWKGDRWAGYGGNTILPATTVTAATLPKATQTTLGGVQVGAGITNTDGVISVDTVTITAAVQASVSIPATKTSLGQVIVGDNVNVALDGTISVPIATSASLGVVKVGTNINIDGTGTLSVPTGAGINTLETIANVNSTGLTAGSLLVYNTGASRWDVTTNLEQQNWDSGQY